MSFEFGELGTIYRDRRSVVDGLGSLLSSHLARLGGKPTLGQWPRRGMSLMLRS